MPRPIEEMSDAQIDKEIENHIAWRRTDKPYSAGNKERYKHLIEARGQRGGLLFEVSLKAIKKAAKEGQFISYGDLAEASGVEWTKAYRLIGSHLWDLVDWGHARGLPMLSAIVVNKENVVTGEMSPDALKGFIAAADLLGKNVSNP